VYADQPAADDCSCSYPQLPMRLCGHNRGTSQTNQTKCGFHGNGGGCGSPGTCPLCNAFTSKDSESTIDCGVTCKATSGAATDQWCTASCNQDPPDCPANLCSCNNKVLVSASDCGSTTITCKAIAPTASDDWCNTNCRQEPPNCPSNLCQCQKSSIVHLASFTTTPAAGADVVVGQMFTLKGSGESADVISDNATFEIIATPSLYPESVGNSTHEIIANASGQGNVCEDSSLDLTSNHFNEPLHIANVAYHGWTCPVSKGSITLSLDFTLPKRPKDSNFTIKAKTANGAELLCVSISMKATEGLEGLDTPIIV